MTTLTTRRFDTRAALDAALAERLAHAIAVAGPSAIMLSGGHTPLPAYRAVASRPPAHDAQLWDYLVMAAGTLVNQPGERSGGPDLGLTPA